MDDDSRMRVTRRRAIGALATVGVASAGAGVGTMAYFSDSASSEENSISAGTIDLSVTDGDQFNYTYENVLPGDRYDGGGNRLSFNGDATNTGSVEADSLAVYIENTSLAGQAGMEDYLLLEELSYGNQPAIADFAVRDGAGETTRPEIEFEGVDFYDEFAGEERLSVGDLSESEIKLREPPEAGGDPSTGGKTLSYDLEVSTEMGNEYQGAEVETILHFALLQDESQRFEGGTVD